jgi:hypothetical protein
MSSSLQQLCRATPPFVPFLALARVPLSLSLSLRPACLAPPPHPLPAGDPHGRFDGAHFTALAPVDDAAPSPALMALHSREMTASGTVYVDHPLDVLYTASPPAAASTTTLAVLSAAKAKAAADEAKESALARFLDVQTVCTFTKQTAAALRIRATMRVARCSPARERLAALAAQHAAIEAAANANAAGASCPSAAAAASVLPPPPRDLHLNLRRSIAATWAPHWANAWQFAQNAARDLAAAAQAQKQRPQQSSSGGQSQGQTQVVYLTREQLAFYMNALMGNAGSGGTNGGGSGASASARIDEEFDEKE